MRHDKSRGKVGKIQKGTQLLPSSKNGVCIEFSIQDVDQNLFALILPYFVDHCYRRDGMSMISCSGTVRLIDPQCMTLPDSMAVILYVS